MSSVLVALVAAVVLLLAPYSATALKPALKKTSAALGGMGGSRHPRGFAMDLNDAANGCKAHATAKECAKPCMWCSSAAVPSACYSSKAAARLPAGVFECK